MKEIPELMRAGKVKGYDSVPRTIETLLSQVFVFDDTVLKRYLRDNEWWNRNMRDLSGGESRSSFIRDDFAFNHLLNPAVYRSLRVARVRDGRVSLEDPKAEDDELVIVMRRTDMSQTFTEVLFSRSLSPEDYHRIGSSFADTKAGIPKDFLLSETKTWYELMRARMRDIETWLLNDSDFPESLGSRGLRVLKREFLKSEDDLRSVSKEQLSVSIDCNSENVLYVDGDIRFMDAYPPRREWIATPFELDIFRVAADIRALDGIGSSDAFLEGVRTRHELQLGSRLSGLYLLYASLISGPYLRILCRKDKRFCEKQARYLRALEDLIGRY